MLSAADGIGALRINIYTFLCSNAVNSCVSGSCFLQGNLGFHFKNDISYLENPVFQDVWLDLMLKILIFTGRRLAQGRQKLLKHLRRGSSHNSSFRQNRSFRLRRGNDGGSKLIILIFLNIETL